MSLELISWRDESSNDMGSLLASKVAVCNRIDILTGYFFFDGFSGLGAALETNNELKLRILVGMDAGLDTRGLVYRVYEYETSQPPADCSQEYLQTLRVLLAHPDPRNSLTSEQAGLYETFSKMIAEGRLEIRKTKHPNHSKVCVFHQGDLLSFSAGSSNFSYSGLCGRNEFNVLADERAHDVAAVFEALWETALPITKFSQQSKTSEDPIAVTLSRDVPTRDIPPFLAYMKVMREYLKLNRSDERLEFRIRAVLREAGFSELDYQIDAVSRAKRILDANGGVIVADVVGLGKSIVGTLLAKLSDAPGVVIAPPHLVEGETGWDGYIDTFKLREAGWSAHSMYDPQLTTRAEVKNAEIVIVDEAHNVRNAESGLYGRVRAAVQGKRVVCLTATPFNNRPDDLVSLVELFGGAEIAGEARGTFIGCLRDIAKRYAKLVDEARDLTDAEGRKRNAAAIGACGDELRIRLAPLTIRRNRLDLRNLYPDMAACMPEQKLVRRTFELSKVGGGDFYEKVVGHYFGGPAPKFSAAMYQPEKYLSTSATAVQRQGNLSKMLLRFLVMRWESSPVAFKATVGHVKDWLKAAVKKFEDEGVFYSGAELNPLTGELVDDGESDVYRAASPAQAQRFLKDLKADFTTLEEVETGFADAGLDDPENDGKLASLIETIQSVFDGTFEGEPFDPANPRKIIVFSQYADTARYVRNELEKHFAGNVAFAEGGLSVAAKQDLETHFRIGGGKARSSEKLILVCTDVLSEGVNLNQAGVVVNYDISWNPVRTIQRIGRINRINSKAFDRIYAVNFFPADETASGVEGISVRKMMMIHRILGEDAKVLSEDEEPAAFLSRITNLNQAEGEDGVSDETKVRRLYEDGMSAKCGNSTAARITFERELDALGFHFAKRAAVAPESGGRLYVFSRNQSAFFAHEVPDLSDPTRAVRNVGCRVAFEAIKCDPDVQAKPFAPNDTDPVWAVYQKVCHRTWAAPALPKLTGKAKTAWDSLTGLPAAVTSRIRQLIGSDAQLVDDLLAAKGDGPMALTALTAAEGRIARTEGSNAVDLMVYGVI